ncbi:hypothetical protein PoB_003394000 [Plakobranchus ocellatus]|uniref:Uncharacterized protein n=1 Tax=Plakobranchus ocellatus TaxID=259542 RepID=A0AAV4AGX5_9GAST|nr:hypothetical protein PoB_003394000 [Plakobranchus ocellatus]
MRAEQTSNVKLLQLSNAPHLCPGFSKRMHFYKIALTAFEPVAPDRKRHKPLCHAPPIPESTCLPVTAAEEFSPVQATHTISSFIRRSFCLFHRRMVISGFQSIASSQGLCLS